MSASLSSPLARSACDGLRLGGAGGHAAAEQAGEDQVGGVAEDPRADRHQPDADDGEQHDRDRLAAVGPHPARPAAWRTGRRSSPSGRPCRRPSGRGRGRALAPRSARSPSAGPPAWLRPGRRSVSVMPPPPRSAGTRRSPGTSRRSSSSSCVRAAADDARRPRARGSGRRRGSWRPAGRRSRPSRRVVTGRSAARSRASVARSSAENESSNR